MRSSPSLLLLLLFSFLLSLFLPTNAETLEHEKIFKELREDCLLLARQQVEKKERKTTKENPLPPSGCRLYAPGGKLGGRLALEGKEKGGEIQKMILPEGGGGKTPHLHVFYRFSLRGLKVGYKHSDNVSPLSLMSFQRALRGLCGGQRKTTSVYIFLNTMEEGQSGEVEEWIERYFLPLGLKRLVIDKTSPAGNMKSWEYLMSVMKREVTNLNDLVLQLEDDYIIMESMLQEIIEVYMTHDFCFVHPSDYPDRYILQKKNFKFGQYNVLPSTRRYWRTIESSTVTYAAKMKTILYFERYLPNPLNDYRNSKALWEQGAEWWSPIPGLSGHMQNCNLASYYVPWMSLVQRNFDDAVQKKLPFLGASVEASLACQDNWYKNVSYAKPVKRRR